MSGYITPMASGDSLRTRCRLVIRERKKNEIFSKWNDKSKCHANNEPFNCFYGFMDVD